MSDYKFWGRNLDPDNIANEIEKLLNGLPPGTMYPEPPVWQGYDEDGDPTLVFEVAYRWYAFYRLSGAWNARFIVGLTANEFLEYQAGWTTSAAWQSSTPADSMAQFEGGGVRSSDEGKPDFFLLLVSDLPYEDQILTRGAQRMADGAKQYARRNHELMKDPEALERCRASLLRHTLQYLSGETDEDHLAAIQCNLVMLSGIEKRVERNTDE